MKVEKSPTTRPGTVLYASAVEEGQSEQPIVAPGKKLRGQMMPRLVCVGVYGTGAGVVDPGVVGNLYVVEKSLHLWVPMF